MDGINSVIRVLVEKKADKTGFSQEYLDFISQVPPEQTTLGNSSDWERTRDVPEYNKKQQITKWQALKVIFNWTPIMHNLCEDKVANLKKCIKSKEGLYAHVQMPNKQVYSTLCCWVLAHSWSMPRQDGREASDVLKIFLQYGFDINWRAPGAKSCLQMLVDEAMEQDTHLWDDGIKLLIAYGADASYFTADQKGYIHHYCVPGEGKYEKPVPKPKVVEVPTPIPGAVAGKSYPDWNAKIDVPYLKEPEEAWNLIKANFYWEPFMMNLGDKDHFSTLQQNEEHGIYYRALPKGQNAFDCWLSTHQHDQKREDGKSLEDCLKMWQNDAKWNFNWPGGEMRQALATAVSLAQHDGAKQEFKDIIRHLVLMGANGYDLSDKDKEFVTKTLAE